MQKKMQLYKIVAFSNADGNFTADPRIMACNLPRGTARKMLETYRAIPRIDNQPAHQFRYIMQRQVGAKREYQPKTGEPCHCKRGVQRDNCPDCEGHGN